MTGFQIWSGMTSCITRYPSCSTPAWVVRGGAAPMSSLQRDIGADRATGPADSDLRSEAYDGSGADDVVQCTMTSAKYATIIPI